MNRFIKEILLVAFIVLPVNSFAEFNVAISGKALQQDARLSGGGMIDQRRGFIGRNSGQKFYFYSDEVYQIRVISYYFQPVLELWDNYGIVASSGDLPQQSDEYGKIYGAEIVFYPQRDGDYFLRTESAYRDFSSGRHSVYVYRYHVDWPGEARVYDYRVRKKKKEPVKQPETVTPPEKPSTPARNKAAYPCECPPGFVHYYGTKCVGDIAPEIIDCSDN